MMLCEWDTTDFGFKPSSHFTVHADGARSYLIAKWFERKAFIKSTYTITTFLLVPDEIFPEGTQDDLLFAILVGDLGVRIDFEVGKRVLDKLHMLGYSLA